MTSDLERRFERAPARTSFGLGATVVVGLLGLAAIGGVGAWALNLAAQPGRIISRTLDADNVLFNYEWFRSQYQDVLAIDAKIAVQEDAAIGAAGDEKVRINSVVAGLKTKRAQMVADYNARGSMANRSIFTAGLPQQIN